MDLSHGLYFSQHVLLALISAGMSRDEAYRIVQSSAMRSWDESRSYLEVLKEDDRVTAALGGPEGLGEVFDDAKLLANIGVVFDRLEAVEI
jgi:adenylosuccinate lyase